MKRCGSIILCVLVLVFVTGCPPAGRGSGPVLQCRGKESIAEAAAALDLQRANLHPLRALARCVMEWTDPDGSSHSETVDAQLRFVPPDRLFVRGDKFGEIRFGTNEEAFWLMVKPELDTYWWGTRRTAERCTQNLQFNPWHVTEALGVAVVDSTWALDWQDGYDILSKTNADGNLTKTIRIRACDYQIVSIETADPSGQQTVRIEMDRYVATEQGGAVPAVIEARHLTEGREDAVLRVELKGIRWFEVDKRGQERLFSRPQADNYGTVYRLAPTCEFVPADP